eukprot:scaffold1503_cov250-Pinguiococcus_pyrenoidosus.AAC.5
MFSFAIVCGSRPLQKNSAVKEGKAKSTDHTATPVTDGRFGPDEGTFRKGLEIRSGVACDSAVVRILRLFGAFNRQDLPAPPCAVCAGQLAGPGSAFGSSLSLQPVICGEIQYGPLPSARDGASLWPRSCLADASGMERRESASDAAFGDAALPKIAPDGRASGIGRALGCFPAAVRVCDDDGKRTGVHRAASGKRSGGGARRYRVCAIPWQVQGELFDSVELSRTGLQAAFAMRRERRVSGRLDEKGKGPADAARASVRWHPTSVEGPSGEEHSVLDGAAGNLTTALQSLWQDYIIDNLMNAPQPYFYRVGSGTLLPVSRLCRTGVRER